MAEPQTQLRGRLGSLESTGAEPASPALERYRDGAAWIAAERVGAERAGLTPVRLRLGTQVFRAQIDGHAIVQLTRGAALAELLSREKLRLVRQLSAAARLYLVAGGGARDEDGLRIAGRLATASGVQEAVPDLHMARVRHAIAIPPDDPEYGGQWYLEKLAIEEAWRMSTGDPDTKVVVIDDGCDMQHPDLRDKFQGGLDVVDQDDDPSYEPGAKNNAHGTQCAGLIGAQTDNAIGMAGVCPECSLLCVRLLPESGAGVPISADIAAFDFALQSGASVVSNSWGFDEATPTPAPMRAMLEELYDNGRDGLGTLVVFAAGNENRELASNEVAAVRGVLAVGAINNFDEAAPFSNYGDSLGITAPAGTFTTDISGPDGLAPGDYTDSFGGTSSACPVVAGVAGLLLSARKDMRASELLDLLEQTARAAPFAEPDSAGHDRTYGYGIIDPAAALRKALGIREPEPDAGSARAGDAGPSAAAETHPDSGGCGVMLTRRGTSPTLGAACIACQAWLGLALWRRRRRRRRRQLQRGARAVLARRLDVQAGADARHAPLDAK